MRKRDAVNWHLVKKRLWRTKRPRLPKGIHDFLVTNQRHTKLLALIAAATLWYFVTSQQRTERDISGIPCTIQMVPHDLVLLEHPHQKLSLRVRGFPNVIYKLNPETLTATIALPEKLSPGSQTVTIKPSMISVPAGVEIVDIQPPVLEVTLEKKVERTIPVHPDIRGILKDGYEMLTITTTPDTIKAVGAESSIAKLDYIFTEPLEITGKDKSYQQSVALAKNSQTRLIEFLDVKTVQVNVIIKESTIYRIVQRPISLPEQLEHLVVTPRVLDLILFGPESAIKRLRPDDIAVMISLDTLLPGEYLLQPVITNVPNLIQVKSYIPDALKIVIPPTGSALSEDLSSAASPHARGKPNTL